MSIKSDKWIRRMAAETGMIEPFEPNQVKMLDGHKIVSYGTSSYGYDIRCADEFKLFTNINTTIVDPKNFDENNFVDVSGKGYCIIPPNSFALARTVEYFRIPRNVLTICLGKSTYARCFSGDTKVALVGRPAMTLQAMALKPDEEYYGYTMLPDGDLGVARLFAPRLVGYDDLLEIELDNGRVIAATPDHRFMRRDGTYVMAQDLVSGDRLMPLYRYGTGTAELAYRPRSGTLAMTSQLLEACKRRFVGLPESITELIEADVDLPSNHRVVSVRKRAGTHPVFCLTVPEGQNFALEDGVIVHNCGIIVNVTPFEPEWEGFVTLEFSNTTPLPAKIYANEGVAQVLFFESDEVCDVSYKDRGGKYQGQVGVTLPKT